MKSTLNETAPAPEIKFPCLMQSQYGPRRIVLFSSATTGTVVSDNTNDRYPIGHYAENWGSCHDRDWKPFNGNVTLSN